VPPQPGAEQQRHADVAGRQQQALAHADLTVGAVQHAEVEREQQRDDGGENEPQPQGLAHPLCLQGGHESVHVQGSPDQAQASARRRTIRGRPLRKKQQIGEQWFGKT